MNVQKISADTAPSLPNPLVLYRMELDELKTDPFNYFGAEVQRRPTKYIVGHTLENLQKDNVVLIAIGGNTSAAFSLSNVESSTLPTKIDEELRTTLISTLKIVEENLDINSENSDAFYEFNAIFMKYGEDSIHCLQDLITGNKINSIFAGKLLRQLGYMANDFLTKLITWLLENFLISKKIPIRNGAVLGLANLNNPETIPSIKKALLAEQIPEIKRNIQRTLERLIKTSKWLNTYEK